MDEWALLLLILFLLLVVAAVVAWALWQENQCVCITPVKPSPPGTVAPPVVPANANTSNSEPVIVATSAGRTGTTTRDVGDYSFHAPSLVGGIPGKIFLGCNEESRKIGGRGNTVAFSSDINNSMTVWKLEVAPNGCWQAPFHSHVVEELWVVTEGAWVFRWYSPNRGTKSLDGNTITFDAAGRPSGPNNEATLKRGEIFVAKRGTFFEWGSNVGGSQVTVVFPGSVMDGAINEVSRIVDDYNSGRIPQDRVSDTINAFGEKYHTPFVSS